MVNPCNNIIEWQQANISADAPYDAPTSVSDYYHNPFDQYGTWDTYFQIHISPPLVEGSNPEAAPPSYICSTCQELFDVQNIIDPSIPGYEQFLTGNLCNPDQGKGAILSGGPKGYYPPLDKNVMVYLCPNYCCQPVTPDPPDPPEDCDCWANGEDYLAWNWDPNPGCCYGCMDPSDPNFDDTATCNIQEQCQYDADGFKWSWETIGGPNPFDQDDAGCHDALEWWER